MNPISFFNARWNPAYLNQYIKIWHSQPRMNEWMFNDTPARKTDPTAKKIVRLIAVHRDQRRHSVEVYLDQLH